MWATPVASDAIMHTRRIRPVDPARGQGQVVRSIGMEQGGVGFLP
jgi:hypothetical protein